MKKLLILVAAVAVTLVSCGGNSLSFENPDSKKDVIASGVAPADIAAWESEVDADFAAVIEALGNDGDLEALEAYDEALRLNSSSVDASRGRDRVKDKIK